MINKSNKGTGRKDLDSYFNLAKNEKVTFSQDNARTLISNYAKTAPVGFLANLGIRSASAFKYLIIGIVSVAGIGLISYAYLNREEVTVKNENVNIQSKNTVEKQSINEKEQATQQKIQKDEIIKTRVNKVDNGLIQTVRSEENRPIAKADAKEDKVITSASLEKNPLPFGFTDEDVMNTNEIMLTTEPLEIQIEDNNELKTVAFDFAKHHGISASTSYGMASIGGKMTTVMSGKLSWIMNKTVSIGVLGSGYVGMNSMSYKHESGEMFHGGMSFGYGGMFIEYTFRPEEKLHYSINTAGGFGGMKLITPTGITQNINYPWASFIFVEPGLNIEYTLNKFIRFGAEASYRYTNIFQKSSEYKSDNNFNNLKLSSITGGLFIKFGFF